MSLKYRLNYILFCGDTYSIHTVLYIVQTATYHSQYKGEILLRDTNNY